MFSELLQIVQISGTPYIRYSRMYNLLNRICIEKSADFKSDYATLFSRLIAVCNAYGIDHRPADRFRHNARLVMNNDWTPNAEEELADVADLCWFIRHLYQEPIPPSLPQHIRPVKVKDREQTHQNAHRGVIAEITSPQSFKCLLDGSDILYEVSFAERQDEPSEDFLTTRYLYQGANVMLLDIQPEQGATDRLQIYMVILEPDYLIDVSALTSCIKPYGASPLNYLLSRFALSLTNKYILMGNLANQFMDDCINGADTDNLFLHALHKNYEQYILDYACCSDMELGADFPREARKQFEHIKASVQDRFKAQDVGIDPHQVLLEPSFICPVLGLRGRLDVMTMDYLRVLELKSGKADNHNTQHIRPKQDHLMQMMLYGEILRRNFGLEWSSLHTYLFYSSYPLFLHERPSASAIRRILHLRNGIVNLMYQIMQGKFKAIVRLCTADHLNEQQLHTSFYERFLLPEIQKITRPLEVLGQDPLLCSYFTSFITFIEREHFLTKTNDNRPDSIRGFAATWTADTRSKLIAGNILTQLTIEEIIKDTNGSIEALRLHIPPYDGNFVPNFAPGVMVQLYEAETPDANVTNSQLIRGTITRISTSSLVLELAFKQRNTHLFSKDRHYAVEHDYSDGPSTQQYRNLFSLLNSVPERRDLILGRRAPQADQSVTLTGTYADHIAPIVLQAKQAQDYYLLVGPPGTGKTNMALRSMVQEFLLDRNLHQTDASILLTAYTNRAVDEICSMLNRLAQELPFDYLRIGTTQTCDPEHHSHLLCQRAAQLPRRTDARKMIDSIPVVVGTVMTLTNSQILFRRKHFSVAIIDEASQILEPQAIGLLCAQVNGRNAIDKFVLIGDHKQLPAVVLLPEAQTQVQDPLLHRIGLANLRNSLFERLHWLERQNGRHCFIGHLNHQGRMHNDICQFVNTHFYNHHLQAIPLPHQETSLNWKQASGKYEEFVASTRMGFIPTRQLDFVENLRANVPEAEEVCQLIGAICSLHRKNGITDFVPEQQIGVIVPFRSQIGSIRSSLREHGYSFADAMTIDTVECYQGSQRDYIIFSTTISEPYQLDILSSVQYIEDCPVDRKLNVAITRARLQFFMVGNEELLCRSDIYSKLIASCDKLE